MAIDKIFNDNNIDGIADNIFSAVNNSVSEVKLMQQRKAAENAQLVIQSLKKMDSDIREKFDKVTTSLEKHILTIKDGAQGKQGLQGPRGYQGDRGLPGERGLDGRQGVDGKDGKDGIDGISVQDAYIDFDGSLIITLSDGRVMNVGEVVSQDIAEKIKVISTMSTNASVAIQNVVIPNATSITVNTDITDIATQANTQAVGTLTINAPTGTAVNGQKFILRLTSTNVQTFSFNAVFAGSTDLTLPTVSSGGGLTDYLGFIYNSTSSKWQMIAKVFGF